MEIVDMAILNFWNFDEIWIFANRILEFWIFAEILIFSNGISLFWVIFGFD